MSKPSNAEYLPQMVDMIEKSFEHSAPLVEPLLESAKVHLMPVSHLDLIRFGCE